LYISIQREKHDFDKLEHLDVQTPQEVLQATERVRRVTWRMGIIGALFTMFLLFCMGVKTSSMVSIGVASWIAITACLNFRAYHVEDIGAHHLKEVLNLKN
jgi:hypothetical protein